MLELTALVLEGPGLVLVCRASAPQLVVLPQLVPVLVLALEAEQIEGRPLVVLLLLSAREQQP